MPALTTMAIVGAAAIGGAATIHSVNQQKKAAKQQTAAMDKQKVEAKERAALTDQLADAGASFNLGRGAAGPADTAGGVSPTAVNRSGSVAARVGGLGKAMGKARASKKLGL